MPKQFTFPFYYEPHPLCILASQELQQYLKTQNEWHHNFGITKNEIEPTGKMFGVLLVQNTKNEIGYLAAFSGKLAGVNELSFFVPPIYDMLNENGFYKKEEALLNSLNVFSSSKGISVRLIETLFIFLINLRVSSMIVRLANPRKSNFNKPAFSQSFILY